MFFRSQFSSKSVPQILAIFLLLLFCTNGLCSDKQGESTAEKERVMPLQPSRNWNIQFKQGYLPSANLQGVNSSAEISDYRFRLNRNFKLDSRITLMLGGAYGLKHINTTADAGLPQDLHSLILESGINYRINERSFASLKLYPGFYSDFGNIGSDDLKMPVLALGGYSFNNGLTLVGGFIYRIGYHSGAFFPVAGLTYQPAPNWSIDLIAPRPGIKYIPSKHISLFLAGDFASDEYELKNRSSGAKALKYSDYKVVGGIEYLPFPETKLTAGLGYAFNRSFEFYDSGRGTMRIDDAPFIMFSLDLGW